MHVSHRKTRHDLNATDYEEGSPCLRRTCGQAFRYFGSVYVGSAPSRQRTHRPPSSLCDSGGQVRVVQVWCHTAAANPALAYPCRRTRPLRRCDVGKGVVHADAHDAKGGGFEDVDRRPGIDSTLIKCLPVSKDDFGRALVLLGRPFSQPRVSPSLIKVAEIASLWSIQSHLC